MSVQNSIDRLNSIKERIRTNLAAQGITVPADAVLADMAEQILSVAGEPGISATHSWNGTTLTVTSASGTSSADLKGPPGDPATVTVDDELSENSTNAIQNKVVTLALADKQTEIVSVEILETICENITFDDSNPTYTLPVTVTLDDSLYYIDCDYYEGTIEEGINEGYSIRAFSKLTDGVVKWGSANEGNGITLKTNVITNNWRDPGNITVISIYKVKITQDNPLLTEAIRFDGHNAFAPGGYHAFAEGYETTAFGFASHAQGYGTVASSNYQNVEGKFNVEDTEGVYVHIVGNGSSDTERSNAHTLDWSGNAWFGGNIIAKQANVTEQVRVDNGTNSMSIWPNGLAGDPKEDSDESKLWIGSDGHGYFTKLYVIDGDSEKEVATQDYVDGNTVAKSGGTMTGALVAQTNENYTTRQVRNVIYVQDGGSVPTTQNGDLVLFYK